MFAAALVAATLWNHALPRTQARPAVLPAAPVPGFGLPQESLASPSCGCAGDPGFSQGISQVEPQFAIGGGGENVYIRGFNQGGGACTGCGAETGLPDIRDTAGALAGHHRVLLDSGMLRLRATDLAIPGRGIDWTFSRVYRSGVSFDGPLGHNWMHNAMRYLVLVSANSLPGIPAPWSGEVALGDVLRVDGAGFRVDVFEKPPAGPTIAAAPPSATPPALAGEAADQQIIDNPSYIAPAEVYTQLTRNGDDSFDEVDRHGNRVHYLAPDNAGVARASLIEDASGNRLELSYLGGGDGRLSTVRDTLGRVITYTYYAANDPNPGRQNRLWRVTDFTGRFIQLDYNAAGELIEVRRPEVAGTPTGNDFPNGVRWLYSYGSIINFAAGAGEHASGGSQGSRDTRESASWRRSRECWAARGDPSQGDAPSAPNVIAGSHLLLTETAPNEAATGGPPRLTVTYDAAIRVSTVTTGGSNYSGVPAGGTVSYFYSAFNTCIPVFKGRRAAGGGRSPQAVAQVFPPDVLVTDPNGNQTDYCFDGRGQILRAREYSNRDVSPASPTHFQTDYAYNLAGELIGASFPAGNSVEHVYDEANANPLARGNRLATIRHADPARGGDQSAITSTFGYEPLFNQVRTITDPRGNDPDHVPSNGGANSPARFTTTRTFDYEEACDVNALALKLHRTVPEVQQLLAAAGICAAPLGDVNGDDRTSDADGQVLRIQSPTVTLLPDSQMKLLLGTTQQPIAETFVYNAFGQPRAQVDAEGNLALWVYHAENRPGDPVQPPTPGVGSGPFGYPRLAIVDAAGSADCNSDAKVDAGDVSAAVLTIFGQYSTATGSCDANLDDALDAADVACTVLQIFGGSCGLLPAAGRNSGFSPAPTNIRGLYLYDPRGNLTREIDGRGVATDHSYNALDWRIQTTQAAAHNIFVPQPVEPLPLTDFAYLRRTHYDPNGNAIVEQVEDRGDTSGVDGQGPFGSLPHGVSNNYPTTANGDRRRYLYDGLDRRTSVVDALGNQTVVQYDAASLTVREARFGPTGGASPTSDGPETLAFPVSIDGVIQPGNLANANLLASTEYDYDEIGRRTQTDRALFVNTIPTFRAVDVDDGGIGAGGDKGSLTSGDTCAVPGLAAPPGGWKGCVSSREEFDKAGRLQYAVDDDKDVHRHFYDGAGRGIRQVDPLGNVTEAAFDDADQLIETRLTEVSQAAGVPSEIFLTTAFYDSLGRLEREVDNLGQTEDYRYDSRGNRVARADAQGPAGPAIARRVFPGGPRTVNTSNLFGNVTRYDYDGLGRRIREERILTASGAGDGVHIGADIFGVKSTPPTPDPAQGGGDGIICTGSLWDLNSLTVARLDDQGNATVYFYDAQDRRVAETGGVTVNTTTANLLVSPSVPAPFAVTIDSPLSVGLSGQRTSIKARLSAVAALFPPLADRVDDNPSVNTKLGLAPDGDRLYLQDQNVTRVLSRYDAGHRLIAARVCRRGQGDSHSGDPVFAPGCPSSTNPPFPRPIGTTRQDYEYDGLGRRVGARDNNEPAAAADDADLALAYDSLGRVIEEQQILGAGGTYLVSAAWRAENLRTKVTYPSGRAVQAFFDPVDRLGIVNDLGGAAVVADYDYIGGDERVLVRQNPANDTRMTFLDNAGTADTGYDGLARPVALRNLRADNSSLADFGHGFDRLNRRSYESKSHATADGELYRYDSASRLVRFERGTLNGSNDMITVPSPNTPLHGQWTLDGAGNWDAVDAETRQHSSFNEIIQRDPGAPIALLADDNGNLYDDGTQTYAWDFANRLRSATKKAGNLLVGSYTYDALGRRVQKVVTNSGSQNGTTRFTLDGWREVEERDAADQLLRQFVYGAGIDEPVLLDRDTDADGVLDAKAYVHPDGRGNVAALSDAAGAVVERYLYDAYGRTRITSGGGAPLTVSAVGNPYQFTGRRVDPETGLLYYRMRYLDPVVGRFLSRDPIGVWGDAGNLGGAYAYVGGNPIDRGDALGLVSAHRKLSGSHRMISKLAGGSGPKITKRAGGSGPKITKLASGSGPKITKRAGGSGPKIWKGASSGRPSGLPSVSPGLPTWIKPCATSPDPRPAIGAWEGWQTGSGLGGGGQGEPGVLAVLVCVECAEGYVCGYTGGGTICNGKKEGDSCTLNVGDCEMTVEAGDGSVVISRSIGGCTACSTVTYDEVEVP